MCGSRRTIGRSDVVHAVEDSGLELWLPGLTGALAEVGWDLLAADLGLDRNSYGTARILGKDGGPTSTVLTTRGISPDGRHGLGSEGIQVELLPPVIKELIEHERLRFCSPDRIPNRIDAYLDDTFEFLNRVPSAWNTVAALVRSLHVVESKDEDYDISWSTPSLPFSVCLSFPNSWTDVAVARVAESLLHEAMHLQLSLLERVVPLVQGLNRQYFSPWRGEWRDAEGILQALYAFGAIGAFFEVMPQNSLSPSVQDHIADRLILIRSQMRQLRGFHECEDLTWEGSRIASFIYCKFIGLGH